MSKSLPEKGTPEYYEMVSEDPSDFIKKPKEVDGEEEETGQNITPKSEKTTTKAKNSA
jgi:hypothetical protein